MTTVLAYSRTIHSISIINCTFENNIVELDGGVMYLQDINSNITYSKFSSNIAERGSGGAIYLDCTSIKNFVN